MTFETMLILAIAVAKKVIGGAVQGLAAIARTGNVNDLVQTSGDYILLDCGTSTDTIQTPTVQSSNP